MAARVKRACLLRTFSCSASCAAIEGGLIGPVINECQARDFLKTAHERVAVLLQFLGGQHRTELPASAIEPLEVGQ